MFNPDRVGASMSIKIMAAPYEPIEITASIDMDATKVDATESAEAARIRTFQLAWQEVQTQATTKLIEAVKAFREIRSTI